MGFMSSRAALTCTILTALLLSACSNDKKPASPAVIVNTLHIYFTQIEENAEQVGKIYSFNPDRGTRTELGSYTPGENMVATMDTDEEQLGIDMAAFVDGQDIKVLNYHKDASRRVQTIHNFNSNICGIYASKIPAEEWFTGDSPYYRRAIDDTAVFVALESNNSCHASDVAYQYLKFDLDRSDALVNSRNSNGVRLHGQFVFDNSFRGFDPDENENVVGRALWIGYNRDTQTIVIETEAGTPLAQASIPFVADPPIIQSPMNGLVTIQAEGNFYKLSLEDLKVILEPGAQIDASNLLGNLLSVPSAIYTQADESNALQVSAEDNALAFADDAGLYQINLKNGTVTTIYNFPVNLEGIQFVQNRDGSIYVQKDFTTHDSMSLFSVETSISEAFIVSQADYINFRAEETSLFVNTFNASDIAGNPVNLNEWTAAKLERTRTRTTYTNSQLVFIEGVAEEDDEILILKADQTNAGGILPTPRVYLYDPATFDGITVFTTDDEDEKSATEVSFGTLEQDVSSVIDNRFGANFIINPRYAGFLTTDNTNYYGYYFDPLQGSSEDDAEKAKDAPSLSLLDETLFAPAVSFFGGFFPGLEQRDFRTAP